MPMGTKRAVEIFNAVAALIGSLSEQSVAGRIDGHQVKMHLVPKGKERQLRKVRRQIEEGRARVDPAI